MKKILFPIAIVATLLVAGCAKENLVEPMGPQNGVTILTAGTPTTKTVLQNDQKVLWTDGDVINVNGVESEALVLDAPSTTATFTIPGVLNNPFKAVFPASIYKDAQTVNLPAVQAYAEGSFGPNVSPMAAYQANANNLNFKHLCAVLKLNIEKGEDTDEIMYVEFSGKNEEQVCGDFSINFEDATLEGASTAASAKKVRCNVYEEISSEGLAVYVAVPAIEYQSGYTVKVVDTKGHFMEISKQSGETLVAGKIYDMPAFEFAPTGTEFNVGITTAAEFCAFTKAYNSGTKPAVAAILNDIEFTASDCAEFVPISSFEGTLKGNHYTISGFNTGTPIVDKATSTAVIEDLTISGTSRVAKLSYTNSTFGTFAATNNGLVQNCCSAVDYTIDENTGAPSGDPKVGAIVGDNNGGTVRDCVNTGNIDLASTYTPAKALYLGGIAGYNRASSYIEGSEMKGRIQLLNNAGGKTYCVGGILGYNNTGTVSNCRTYPIVDDSKKAVDGDYKATFMFSATSIGTINSGGIVGQNAKGVVESCTNEADIIASCSATSGGNLRVTGVVGVSSGTVRSCVNSASVTSYASLRTRWVAGLCAENSGTIADSRNEGNILVGGPNNVGQGNNIGGLIAYNHSVYISNLTNDGDVTVEMLAYDNQDMFLRFGGCIGLNSSAIDGKNLIVNNGDVVWDSKNGTNTTSSADLGGVIGQNSANVKGCINNGKVQFKEHAADVKGQNINLGGVVGKVTAASSISECTNNGAVSFSLGDNVDAHKGSRSYTGIYMGGILGYNSAGTMTVSNCTNTGTLDGGLRYVRNNGGVKHFGGIVGYLTGASSTVTGCKSQGTVISRDQNHTWNSLAGTITCAGLVGAAVGTEAAPAVITNCDVMKADGSSVEVKAYRANVAGFVGWAKYAQVSDCECNIVSEYDHATCGGVCAWMEYASAENCTVNMKHKSVRNYSTGGLVAKLDGNSSLNKCSFKGSVQCTNAQTSAYYGLLVGDVTSSGATIKNCKYSGTVQGAAFAELTGDELLAFLVGNNAANITTFTDNTPLAE